jgi:hypothetical protein
MSKRFQECNKIEKLWRYRWYLLLPFVWLRIKFSVLISKNVEDLNMTNKNIWKISKGLMQSKMKWYYTMDEVMDSLKEKMVDKTEK